ncbi:uncharacterized protein LOC125654540 isoform X2 [Ostrea edulis]|uniref:uncharacterized protein LOC125654540 isoform X2 n=1 Tax=Ostrea edulis TaxID=37623 RepID=UPI0024AEB078|nr:uncharacterized protein LOC125654540 isoform X2 [Ostrea edulis]
MCIQYMWSLYFVYAIAEMETPCDRRERQGHQCCPGSFFNLTVQECQVCPAGYTGLNCSDICLPGLYGMECQIKCPLECSVTCDHTTGICPDQRENPLTSMLGEEDASYNTKTTTDLFESVSKGNGNDAHYYMKTSTETSPTTSHDNDLPYLSGYDRKRELTGSCPSHGSHTSYFDTGDIFF